MATDFTFGQIEAACAHLNGVAPHKRVAFGGRLKQLQKHGLTEEGGRPGRGKPGVYGFNELMRFVIALELIQTGMTPQRATGLINRNRNELYRSIAWWSATVTLGYEEPFYWVVKPQELSGLRVGPSLSIADTPSWDQSNALETVTIETVKQSDITDAIMAGAPLERLLGNGWRTLILNGSSITEAVFRAVCELGYAKSFATTFAAT